MDTVELKLCVVTTLTRRGKGRNSSPIRIITEVWDAQTGRKIAEQDPDQYYDYADDMYYRGEPK